MKRTLLILVLVLLSSMAIPTLIYAATGTLTYSIIPPSGGPPTPPTQAAVAGFTTCVICYDFTQTTGGIFVNGAAVPGANASQTNTYLDCANATNPVLFREQNGSTVVPCPTITTDSGMQVMQFQVPVAGTTPSTRQWVVSYCGNFCDGHTGKGNLVPTFNYFEVKLRIVDAPANGFVAEIFTGGAGEVPNSTYNGLEFDCCEINMQGGGANNPSGWNYNSGSNYIVTNFGPDFNTNDMHNVPGYDGNNYLTQYLTSAIRMTSDGSTILYFGRWFQNTLITNQSWACCGGYPASSLSDTNSKMQAVFGGVDNTATAGGTATVTVNVEHIYMWSCANWQTTACSTPGNPNPGGY